MFSSTSANCPPGTSFCLGQQTSLQIRQTDGKRLIPERVMGETGLAGMAVPAMTALDFVLTRFTARHRATGTPRNPSRSVSTITPRAIAPPVSRAPAASATVSYLAGTVRTGMLTA